MAQNREMLLIRPWIRMNRYRVTAHHIVFFIFIVANIGGCLTPIGDPPLFLGYLKGIPFWWVAEHCWPMWLVGVGVLLAMFFVVDTINFRRAPETVREKETAHETWRFDGWPGVEAVESTDLHEAHGVTKLTQTLAFRDKAGRDRMTKTDGLEASYDNVEDYLRSLLDPTETVSG